MKKSFSLITLFIITFGCNQTEELMETSQIGKYNYHIIINNDTISVQSLNWHDNLEISFVLKSNSNNSYLVKHENIKVKSDNTLFSIKPPLFYDSIKGQFLNTGNFNKTSSFSVLLNKRLKRSENISFIVYGDSIFNLNGKYFGIDTLLFKNKITQ